jgi:anti-sigma regulatory factor (Ser/Thr protein kinase)
MSDERRDLDVSATLRLPPVPQSAREARRFITEFCRASDLPDELCHTAALLTSELVTNAVLHGRTSATIEVHRPPGVLRVAVVDDNPELPDVGKAPSFTRESGRGLAIVAMLAPDWGVEATGSGKAVWFELPTS